MVLGELETVVLEEGKLIGDLMGVFELELVLVILVPFEFKEFFGAEELFLRGAKLLLQ